MAGDKTIKKRIGKDVAPNAATPPTVSVVIPVYNVAEYIAETLDSVLAQTFADYEIIVVNDGSPDTPELEKALAPYLEKIVYLRQPNGGSAAARNTGIEHASGRLLAFLDGDDIWLPEYLENQIAFLENGSGGKFEMIYCDALLFGENLRRRGETFMRKAPSRGAVTPESLLSGDCSVITSGTLVEKNAVVRGGLFDAAAHRTEDFELWFRLAKLGARIGYQKKVLLKYRVRTSGLTGDGVRRAERTRDALRIVREKNALTTAEEAVWRERMRLSEAEISLEKGKSRLARGQYIEARQDFRQANHYYRKFKLRLVAWLMEVNPKLVFLLFKKFRAEDYSFTLTDKGGGNGRGGIHKSENGTAVAAASAPPPSSSISSGK